MTDVWTSVVVVFGVTIVAFTGWLWLDPLLGLLLAFHIIAVGVRLIRNSLQGLMDSSLDPTDLEIIRNQLEKYASEDVEYHALRTRIAGSLKFMSVHLLMPGAWTILRGHDIAERLENDLRQALPGLIVFTHLEPREDPKSWEDVKLAR